jgi:tetratricopeptide (TPR) repeat protein
MAVTYSEVGLTGIPPSAAAYSAYADALSTLAGIEFESGRSGEADARFEAAVHAYRQALAMAPDSIDCRLGLSTALVGHGKLHAGGRDRVTAEASYREAITRYDEALAITAPSALVEHGRGLAHFNLAALLAWHREYDAAEQSLSEALRAFDRTMALAPLHWEASNNRGYALRAIALLRVEGGRAVGDALHQSMSAFVNGWQLCPNADSLHGMSANRLTVCRAAPLADGCRSLAEIVAILPTWKERFPWDRRAAEIEGEVATARRELGCADPE